MVFWIVAYLSIYRALLSAWVFRKL